MPRISIIVPCRNEAAAIDAFIASALAQQLDPGDTLELVVADGASDDGTAALLHAWQQREPRLVVIANPDRITSAALNRAIAASSGSTVVRMDVHTAYATDYVAQCLHALRDSGAVCVGGAWRPVVADNRSGDDRTGDGDRDGDGDGDGDGGRQGAIARAFRSSFGSGGAASRRVDYSGEVDTVYLGAWRRDDLLRLGGFDEALVRNQDDELNLRIVRGGGRVWQSAAIRSWYTPRASYAALFRQFYQYGYWKVPVIRKHRLPASPRHLVPFGFVALLAVLALAGAAWRPAWGLLAIVSGIYGAAALASAWAIRPRQAPAIAWAFFCMHAGYGLGFGRGLLDVGLLKRAPGAAATRLTR